MRTCCMTLALIGPIKIIELGCGAGYHTLQKMRKRVLLRDLFDLELSEKYDIVHSQGLLEKLHLN